MSLSPGTRLEQYVILSPLGAGGMGEVYRARDTRLGRDVALKVLPAAFSAHEERLSRFRQEACNASALNHPNIITVYEIGQREATCFIATEFIDGETLRRRAAHAPLTLRETLDIAIQIASALDAAHRAGVVHRDIKPENVMVREDGIVKVLDFGLAKLSESADGARRLVDTEAETRGLVNTAPGVVLGTIYYMSPEQARGLEVDARSDIFSFGVVLYEVLAGRRPFAGKTGSDILVSVLRDEPPPLEEYFPGLPAEMARIVGKSLRKDREERYQSSKELLVDLKSLRQELEFEAKSGRPSLLNATRPAGRRSAAPGAATGRAAHVTAGPEEQEAHHSTISELLISEVKQHRKGVALTAALAALALAAAAFGLYRLIESARRPDAFQSMQLTRLTRAGDVVEKMVAISPDGRHVAYVTQDEGRQSLWVRQVATSGNAQVVPPSPNGYHGLTFSRDGDYIYYAVLERQDFPVLYRVPTLGGGPPRKLVEEAIGPVTFSPDGRRMAFIRGDHTLMVSDADGGGARALAGRPGVENWQLPSWSPDGEKIACGVFSPEGNIWRLVEVSVKDGTERPLTEQRWQSVWGLAWLPAGDGLMVSGRYQGMRHLQLWLLSYPGGEVRRVTNDLSSYVGLSLTADGQTLASVQGERLINVWVAPAADAERARRVTTEAGRDEGLIGLAWTPDGRVVYVARANEGSDIWIVGEDGRENVQLTANARDNHSPCVTPDGRHVVFVSNRTGRAQLWRMGLDGGNPAQLTDQPGMAAKPDCSPDGRWVYYHLSAGGARNVWKVALDGGAPVRLTDVASARPAVSPDGRLVACAYGEAKPDAQVKLAVIPSEGGPPVRLIEAPAAIKSIAFRWSPDGRRIVYIDSRDRVSNLWEQPLDGGQPTQLTNFKTDHVFQFDWSRDGQRLALARGRVGSDVVLISNFHDR